MTSSQFSKIDVGWSVLAHFGRHLRACTVTAIDATHVTVEAPAVNRQQLTMLQRTLHFSKVQLLGKSAEFAQ